MKTIGSILLFGGLLLGSLAVMATPAPLLAQIGCGLTPLKPLPPLGCKDLVAQCTCDNRGKCYWEWICVRR